MVTGIPCQRFEMKKRALYNRCPEPFCREETLWMPYEDRCGKCGYGGKPKHSNVDTKRLQDQQDISQAALYVIGVVVIFIIGFVAGNIFSGLGLFI